MICLYNWNGQSKDCWKFKFEQAPLTAQTLFVLFPHLWGHFSYTCYGWVCAKNGNGPTLRPTTEIHGTKSPNVTIAQMMDNLNAYLGKRLELRKCHDDICQKYGIKHSERGIWALPDIKRAYGKMQRLRTNTNRDGLSVILVKQILQHRQKCETDKSQREYKAEKAKVWALAEQLQKEKKDKERLLNDNDKLLKFLSTQLDLKDCSGQKTPIKYSSKREKELLYPFKDLKKIWASTTPLSARRKWQQLDWEPW